MDITAGLAKLKTQINKLEKRIHNLDMDNVSPKELHPLIESLNALKARYKEMKEEHEKKKQEKESKVIPMDKDTVVKEHEHLVDVLKSPSHADDKQEAVKQEKELAEYKEAAPEVPAAQPPEEPKKDTLDGGAIIMKFPRRPHRKQPRPHKVVDVPTPSAIPGEAPQEKQSDVAKFAIHDVVEPARGTPGSKGRVMGHDEANDMVYVAWQEGALKDSHGYGAYSAKDLKKHASQTQAAPDKHVSNEDLTTPQGFFDYCWQFYGPEGMHGDFFGNKLNPEDLKKAIAQRMASGQFEGDTFDREAVRDILFTMPQYKKHASLKQASESCSVKDCSGKADDVINGKAYCYKHLWGKDPKKKDASLDKQAGPGAGREFKVNKNSISDGSFIYNMETGKVTWKEMPQILAFDLMGYYDGIRDADGRLLKITDVASGWWERGEANVKSDLATVMKEWMQEMPHQWEGITGDVEVGVGFRGLEAMLGGGYMRTVYKPGDTFQACGDGYLTANYDMYEIGLCATIQAQEEFDHFEKDVFEDTYPPEEPDEEGNVIDPETWYDMQTDNYRAPRNRASKKDNIKKEAASGQLSQKLLGDLKRQGWEVTHVSNFSVDLKRGPMSLEIYDEGASGYEDSQAMIDSYMTKNQALTDQCQKDFETTYTQHNWVDWREQWVKDVLKKKPIHSGNTYNDDPAYFWGTTFEYTYWDDGAIFMFHHGGDVRGNYGLPEVWDGDFEEVYSLLSHQGGDDDEISNFISQDLLDRIRAEVWGKDMAEIPSVSSKRDTLMKQAASNEAVIDSFINRINPDIKSNNLYIKDRGDGWDLINYQTVIAKHLGDKILLDDRQYSVTTSKLQGLIGYKASLAGLPIYDMATGQPLERSKKREKAPTPPFSKLPSGQPYERVSEKKADDHDVITDEPMEEEVMDDEPTDEDIFIQDDRGKTHAWYTGKPIASLENDDWDAFYMDIAKWMAENGYSPNVWMISDHGNAHLVTDLPQAEKTAAGYEPQSQIEEIAESFINGNISWVRQQLQRRPKLKKQISEWMREFAPRESESFDRLMGVVRQDDVHTEGSSEKSADHLYGISSIHAEQGPNGDLVITVSDIDELNEIKNAVASGDQSDASMYDVFEHLIANGYSWVSPEEIGALTDAPILSDSPSMDDGSIDPKANIWWYPDYQLRSPLEDIAENGQVIFQLAKPDTTAAFQGQKLVKKATSDGAKSWISKKIKILMDEGKPQDQAIAIAHSMARDKGFKVPEKKADLMETKCEDCGKELGPEVFLSKYPVCGSCIKKRHKDVTSPGWRKKKKAEYNPKLDKERHETHEKGNHADPADHCKECEFRFGLGKSKKANGTALFDDIDVLPEDTTVDPKLNEIPFDPKLMNDLVEQEKKKQTWKPQFRHNPYMRKPTNVESSGNQIPLNVFDGGFYAVETSGTNPEAPHGYAIFDPKGQQVMVITTNDQLSPERLSSIVHDEYGKRELVRATLTTDHQAFKKGTSFKVSGINRAKKEIRVTSDKEQVWIPMEKVAVTVDLEQHIQQMKDRLNTTQQTLEQAVTTKAEVEVKADDVNTPPPQVLPEGQKWMWNPTTKRWVITTVK